MKTYTIKTIYSNPKEIEISEQEIRKLLKENPELLTPTPTHKRKYFVPKHNENYYFIDSMNDILLSVNDGHRWDLDRIKSGNCFATEQDAQDELNRRQALVRIWNNYDDKYSWDIDWDDIKVTKYGLAYDYDDRKIDNITSIFNFLKYSTELPYFKSAEDRNQFIESNKEDLLTIFNIKK